MALNTSRAAAGASPLWIIALFIALSEVTAGVAAITTDGAARLIFAIFAVSFPVVVLVCFAWLLVAHTPKLYPPDQYSDDISPERYARGVRGISKSNLSFVGETVFEALAEERAVSGISHEQTERTKVELLERFEQSARERAITVDISGMVPGADEFLYPADESSTVNDFLDSVYFQITPRVGPFEYLSSWVLRREDGELLIDDGPARKTPRGQPWSDTRRLREVGIRPGEKYVVERVEGGRVVSDGRIVQRRSAGRS